MKKKFEKADEIKLVDELRALLLYATGAGYREATLPRYWSQTMELVAKYKSLLEGYAAELQEQDAQVQKSTSHSQVLKKIASKLAIENKGFPVNQSSEFVTQCLDEVRDQIEHVHCEVEEFLKLREIVLSHKVKQIPMSPMIELFERVAVAQERSVRLLERIESSLAHGKYVP